MKETNPSRSPIVRSVFKENAGYRIGKGCLPGPNLPSLFKSWVAHNSLEPAVLRMAFTPTQASAKRWKTARKKRPTQAPNVAAAVLMNVSG